MQTVILKSVSTGIIGVLDYSVSKTDIKINYSITREQKANTPILKLIALSSHRPFNMPVVADTLEFGNLDASGEVSIGENTLAYNGYNTWDIDTFCVIEKGAKKITPLAVGYANLIWNIQTSLDNMTKRDKVSPLVRGEMLLKSIKKPPCDKNSYLNLIKEIEKFCKTLDKSTYLPIDDYKWYKLSKIKAPLNISSYCHLLYVPKVQDAFLKEKCLLLGIKTGGKTALAIKAKGENPFVNADDCAVKQGDFWVVGVEFKEDGQYFTRIEQDTQKMKKRMQNKRTELK